MPHAKADAHVEERHALGLGVPPSNLPDVAVIRIALGHGQDEGDDGADDQGRDEGSVRPQPRPGGERAQTHVEEDDGDLDDRDGNVEQPKGGRGHLASTQRTAAWSMQPKPGGEDSLPFGDLQVPSMSHCRRACHRLRWPICKSR